MINGKHIVNKHQIIKEYLSSDQTFKGLGEKYGLPARTIQTWVRTYRKSHPEQAPVAVADKDLQKRLAHTELKNELLEEILKIAEEETGIDFKKKFGARQS